MITPSFSLTATERVLPKLALDFTTASLDPRITFTRSLNTATRVNSSGYIETVNANLPRFDYDPVTLACKGLLIEESRTNVYTYSNDLSQSAWTKTNVTISSVNVTDPAGNSTCQKIIANSGQTSAYISRSTTNASSCVSFYAKYVDSQYISLGTAAGKTVANLIAGTLSKSSDAYHNWTITNAGNGWWRITTQNKTVTTYQFQVNPYVDSAGTGLAGDGVIGVCVYGFQDEVGTFPTSYIPTDSTVGGIVRNADVATMTGTNFSSWFNSSEGAMEIQYDIIGKVSGAGMGTQMDDGTLNNRIVNIGQEFQSPNTLSGSFIATGGAAQMNSYPAIGLSINTVYKNCVTYKTNNGSTTVNSTLLTDNTLTVPSGLTTLRIGSRISDNYLNGHMQKINYWPQRITNAETQAFTK